MESSLLNESSTCIKLNLKLSKTVDESNALIDDLYVKSNIYSLNSILSIDYIRSKIDNNQIVSIVIVFDSLENANKFRNAIDEYDEYEEILTNDCDNKSIFTIISSSSPPYDYVDICLNNSKSYLFKSFYVNNNNNNNNNENRTNNCVEIHLNKCVLNDDYYLQLILLYLENRKRCGCGDICSYKVISSQILLINYESYVDKLNLLDRKVISFHGLKLVIKEPLSDRLLLLALKPIGNNVDLNVNELCNRLNEKLIQFLSIRKFTKQCYLVEFDDEYSYLKCLNETFCDMIVDRFCGGKSNSNYDDTDNSDHVRNIQIEINSSISEKIINFNNDLSLFLNLKKYLFDKFKCNCELIEDYDENSNKKMLLSMNLKSDIRKSVIVGELRKFLNDYYVVVPCQKLFYKQFSVNEYIYDFLNTNKLTYQAFCKMDSQFEVLFKNENIIMVKCEIEATIDRFADWLNNSLIHYVFEIIDAKRRSVEAFFKQYNDILQGISNGRIKYSNGNLNLIFYGEKTIVKDLFDTFIQFIHGMKI